MARFGDALNAELDTPVPMERFRMNVVVEGLAPHAEDALTEIKGESVRLLHVTPGEAGAGALDVEVEGLQSVTGALEIAGDVTWFADTTLGASGLRAFTLEPGAVEELPDSPFPVGLPPMSLAPLTR